MKTVNSYVLVGDEIVLIDCGEDTDASFEALKAGLKFHDLYLEDIDRIILTHAHVDHMGMAQRVAESADAPVWVSELVYSWAVDPLAMWTQRKEIMIPSLIKFFEPAVHDFITTGYLSFMQNMQDVWKPVDEHRLRIFESEGKMKICGDLWQVLHLPGHSYSQSTFYNSSTHEFISADMLLRITPTPVIEPDIDNPTRRNRGILQMLNSFDRVLNMKLGTVYPGHYESFDNGHDLIHKQMRRIEFRKNECYQIICKGEHSFFNIYNEMYKGNIHMPAIIMLIGYLDLLEEEGLILIKEKEGYKQIFAV